MLLYYATTAGRSDCGTAANHHADIFSQLFFTGATGRSARAREALHFSAGQFIDMGLWFV